MSRPSHEKELIHVMVSVEKEDWVKFQNMVEQIKKEQPTVNVSRSSIIRQFVKNFSEGGIEIKYVELPIEKLDDEHLEANIENYKLAKELACKLVKVLNSHRKVLGLSKLHFPTYLGEVRLFLIKNSDITAEKFQEVLDWFPTQPYWLKIKTVIGFLAHFSTMVYQMEHPRVHRRRGFLPKECTKRIY